MPAPHARHARPQTGPRERASRPPAWVSLAAGAAALGLYLAWCPHVAGDKDGPEFTLVLATLGLAHPTGYPLYTLLGHVFARAAHAAGADWAWAANAWSAAGAAVAIGLLHALAARLLVAAGVRARAAAFVALLPVAAFAFDPVWTSAATLAEVNSWHVAWAAGAALFAASRLACAPAQGAARVRDAALWGLLVGLGLAHHRTSLLLAAPLTVALFVHARPVRARAWLAALGGLALPLLAYAYVFWRAAHPAAVQWPLGAAGPADVWAFVSGEGYAHFLGRFAPSAPQRVRLALYVLPLLAPGLAAASAWPFVTARAPRGLRVAFAAGIVASAAYVLLYGVPDPAPYFLAPLALGLAVLPALLAGFATVRRAAVPATAAAALAVALAAWPWSQAAMARGRAFARFDALARRMWAAIPGERGFVLWEDDMWYRLLGYQLLDGSKPGLVVVNPVALAHPDARAAFAARHGFDPFALLPPGAPLEGDGAALDPLREAIVERLGRTGEPVYVFLPRVPSVRLLRAGAPSGR